MVNAPAASTSSSNGKAAAYATLASSSDGVQEQGLLTAFPSDPFAPSLSHLSGSGRLPPGYAKASSSETHATFLPVIEQSANDDRAYRLIKLDNGMECLVVSDPKTDKSAAGISVRVGHLSDPENAQGMAHFCEHLLFMGTEKYPSENDYNEYLSRNNGQSNAYTAMDETVYYFDVHPPALPGALDRFAQFFIAPLFTDSCTEREILAVDSENKKNLQSDMWRMYQLEKSTSSKQHSYWRFGTGNKQTLWDDPVSQGRNVRSELLEWYGRHYSANVMKLVVLGKGE
jgi:insulysin